MVDLETILPLVLPGVVILLWYLRTRHRLTVGRLIAVAMFAVYLLMVSSYTIFPLRFDSAYIEAFRSQTRLLDGVKLVPFRDMSLRYLTSVQGWGNLVLGIPWGFLYPFVVPVLGWRAIARSGACFSAAIELTQLAISVLYGFAYRVTDINDFLLNVTGVLIGYALLRLLALIYRSLSRRDPRDANPRSDKPWGHLESVLLAHGRSGVASR
ncbi:VanZ family protein [Hyalangium gracile]|uniref:VanZ family protein n=1 Tax=Hyalangium gracile TaxID=394092 RepID=UPI001CCA2E1D|nr:VanZ family protein [Hyalangium gracile]